MEKEFVDLLKKKAAEQSKNPVDSKMLEAKKNVVQQIMEMLHGDMADKMKGLKKVTVASDSPEGITEGLDKAKDMLSGNEEGSDMEESLESPEEESHEDEGSEDEIAELERKLAELKSKKKMV